MEVKTTLAEGWKEEEEEVVEGEWKETSDRG